MKTLLFIFLPVLCFATPVPVHVIPEPAELTVRDGYFKLTKDLMVDLDGTDSAFATIAKTFLDELYSASGLRLRYGKADGKGIQIRSARQLAPEGYSIEIRSSAMVINARDAAGLFYAFKTVRQLLPTAFFAKKRQSSVGWQLPCISIADYPRFPYRGMHLDVSRHFFSIDFLKQYLDILAFYKINTFHWHLTDSHGWRLEIKKYPKLTSVGAWRAKRDVPMTIAPPTAVDEPAGYGGFYSQDQVKELIRYAKERFITIIPEIEMPGHCDAAVVAYPEYTCLNNPVPLLRPTGYEGDLQHNFCPGNDSTFTFLQGVLDEVMALFPSEYIHIGGDEVKPASWMTCPRCRKRMKDEHLTSARQLQSYFTHRIDQYITSKHRRLIGWDEIMEAGISQNAAVMSWRGNAGGIAASKAGHAVVMTPYPYVYFDFYQSAPELEPDITYAALPLEKVYAFEPVPADADKDQKAMILGGQACLWTENVATPDRVEYMLLPRMLALAECLWSPAAAKDYRRFVDRCEAHFQILQSQNINYARSLYNVTVKPQFDRNSKKLTLTLADQTAGKYLIRYNTRGDSVTASDPVYSGPLVIATSGVVSTALFNNDTMIGKTGREKFSVHRALGATVSLTPAAIDTNVSASLAKLTDGIHGTFEPYDGRWAGLEDSTFSLLVELPVAIRVHSVSFDCLEDMVGNMLIPETIKIQSSSDGITFNDLFTQQADKIPQQKLRHIVHYSTGGIAAEAKFIRLQCTGTAKKFTADPSSNRIMIDELVVE